MCVLQETKLARWILYVFIIVVTAGCDINTGQTSPYIKDIVTGEPWSWFLSPMGDKLLYDTRSNQDQAIVRDLLTNEEITIADCFQFNWLTNEDVYCYNLIDDAYEPFVVTIDVSGSGNALQTSLIKEVAAEKMEQEHLLEQADIIYRLYERGKPNALLIVKNEPARQFYHIVGIDDLEKVLENQNYLNVPISGGDFVEYSQKHYSPNGEFYYLITQDQETELGIYDATTEQRLIELRPNYRPFFQIGGQHPNQTKGWASDSSGIYFRYYYSSGFIGPEPRINPVQKLSAPK